MLKLSLLLAAGCCGLIACDPASSGDALLFLNVANAGLQIACATDPTCAPTLSQSTHVPSYGSSTSVPSSPNRPAGSSSGSSSSGASNGSNRPVGSPSGLGSASKPVKSLPSKIAPMSRQSYYPPTFIKEYRFYAVDQNGNSFKGLLSYGDSWSIVSTENTEKEDKNTGRKTYDLQITIYNSTNCELSIDIALYKNGKIIDYLTSLYGAIVPANSSLKGKRTVYTFPGDNPISTYSLDATGNYDCSKVN